MKRTQERLLLDESRFDYRRRPNLAVKVFLAEVEGGLSFIEKAKLNPDLPLHVVGIVQTGDKPNRNGRIYPFAYLKDMKSRENNFYYRLFQIFLVLMN